MTTLDSSSRPVRRRVVARNAPHGVTREITVTIYPDGDIGLREMRRPARTEKRLAVGELYALAVQWAVMRMGRRVRELAKHLPRAEARKQARKEAGL